MKIKKYHKIKTIRKRKRKILTRDNSKGRRGKLRRNNTERGYTGRKKIKGDNEIRRKNKGQKSKEVIEKII